MSKLEIILVTAIVCILAGAGAIYWQRSHRPVPRPVAAPTKPPVQDVEQPSRQMSREENQVYWALKDCRPVLERASAFSKHCKSVREKQQKNFSETSDATIRNIGSQSAQNQAEIDRLKAKGLAIARDMEECTRVQSELESIKDVIDMIKHGMAEEADRLCFKAARAFPAGF